MPKARPAALSTPDATAVESPLTQQPPLSYEAAMAELDQLVGHLESGETPLEQLLSDYQRGAFLLQFCRARLQSVEDQIKVLDEGALKPWKLP